MDHNTIAENTYTGTISFTTTTSTFDVPVLMQRFTATTTDDAGRHYIDVFDPDTQASVASGSAEASNGIYDYTVTDVPFGEYLIYAGTNFDNDADICDPGETCGAYLSLDLPTPLLIDSDQSGIDFATGFDLTFGATNAPTGSSGRTSNPDPRLLQKQIFTLSPR